MVNEATPSVEVEQGDKIEFVFQSTNRGRMVITDAEVLEVAPDKLVVEGETHGLLDTYILIGESEYFESVYRKRTEKPNVYLGDQGRIR